MTNMTFPKSSSASGTEVSPRLTHLNADTSWLLQLPHPAPSQNGRRYFNILIDPWLTGPQADVAPWFSTQSHMTPSVFETVAEVNKLALGTEDSAENGNTVEAGAINRTAERGCIDAVVISHEFTDHCHEATLREVQRDVPVFAPDKAAILIRSFNHFSTVNTIPDFQPADQSWPSLEAFTLPPWLRIGRLPSASDWLYYHSAIILIFSSDPISTSTPAQSVIYTPHGLPAETSPSLTSLPTTSPPIQTLALLHGLHAVYLGKQLNLGGPNGVRMAKALQPKYWFGTHDEVKKGSGIVGWFLRRKIWGMEEARGEVHGADIVNKEEAVAGMVCKDLENGEGIVLA
ncbi:MAG: hypothetical protein M1814_005409 [Vezdaea aestivalis]|nr:MAG: hypothetical protein M1814_005409 [Vezdaea aestivalis]